MGYPPNPLARARRYLADALSDLSARLRPAETLTMRAGLPTLGEALLEVPTYDRALAKLRSDGIGNAEIVTPRKRTPMQAKRELRRVR